MQEIPTLSFSEALSTAFKKPTQFTGRSRRSEYWWCYLAVVLISLVSSFIPFIGSAISSLLSLAMIPLTFRRLHDTGHSGWWYGVSMIMSVVFGVYFFAALITAGLTDLEDQEMLAKGFMDIFLSPVCLGLMFAGLVYSIVLLVFLVKDSDPNENKYGESPKYKAEQAW